MSAEVLLNRIAHKSLVMFIFGAGRVSISRAILTTSFLKLSLARCYGGVVSSLVEIVGDITYAIRVIEVPDSDNVSMNYRETLPYRVSLKVRVGPQRFPISCN